MECDVRPIDLAISAAGSLAELARRLGVSQQRVSNWKRRGIPDRMVLPVARVTGVPRYKLNEELYPRTGARAE